MNYRIKTALLVIALFAGASALANPNLDRLIQAEVAGTLRCAPLKAADDSLALEFRVDRSKSCLDFGQCPVVGTAIIGGIVYSLEGNTERTADGNGSFASLKRSPGGDSLIYRSNGKVSVGTEALFDCSK